MGWGVLGCEPNTTGLRVASGMLVSPRGSGGVTQEAAAEERQWHDGGRNEG